MSIRIILMLMAVAALASGCQLFEGSETGSIPDTSDAFKGTEGLAIKFFDGAPPEKAFPGSQIQVALLFENNGAASIKCDSKEECGKFLIFSKPPVEFTEKDSLFKAIQQESNKLPGKESYLSGGRAAYETEPITVTEPPKTTSSLVFAAACYQYKTKLSTPVCIPTAPFAVPEESRACQLQDLTFRGQGAPVAIRKIEQTQFITEENSEIVMKPHLRIFIANAGKGIVLENSKEAFEKACTVVGVSEGIESRIIGKIMVGTAEVGGQQLDCQGETIQLTGQLNKDFIECKSLQGFNKDDYDNNFVTTLNLELSYGYQTSASKEITIEVPDKD